MSETIINSPLLNEVPEPSVVHDEEIGLPPIMATETMGMWGPVHDEQLARHRAAEAAGTEAEPLTKQERLGLVSELLAHMATPEAAETDVASLNVKVYGQDTLAYLRQQKRPTSGL